MNLWALKIAGDNLVLEMEGSNTVVHPCIRCFKVFRQADKGFHEKFCDGIAFKG